MRRIVPPTLIAVSLFTLLAGILCARAAERPTPGDKAVGALIVTENAIPKSGVGSVQAIKVIDQKKLADLASFFPKYRERPSSTRCGAWEAAYRIYFDHPGGECIRVSVSHSGESWSVGRGDLQTAGDLQNFVQSLQPGPADPP